MNALQELSKSPLLLPFVIVPRGPSSWSELYFHLHAKLVVLDAAIVIVRW
jgi:hypothetical protein